MLFQYFFSVAKIKTLNIIQRILSQRIFLFSEKLFCSYINLHILKHSLHIITVVLIANNIGKLLLQNEEESIKLILI